MVGTKQQGIRAMGDSPPPHMLLRVADQCRPWRPLGRRRVAPLDPEGSPEEVVSGDAPGGGCRADSCRRPARGLVMGSTTPCAHRAAPPEDGCLQDGSRGGGAPRTCSDTVVAGHPPLGHHRAPPVSFADGNAEEPAHGSGLMQCPQPPVAPVPIPGFSTEASSHGEPRPRQLAMHCVPAGHGWIQAGPLSTVSLGPPPCGAIPHIPPITGPTSCSPSTDVAWPGDAVAQPGARGVIVVSTEGSEAGRCPVVGGEGELPGSH